VCPRVLLGPPRPTSRAINCGPPRWGSTGTARAQVIPVGVGRWRADGCRGAGRGPRDWGDNWHTRGGGTVAGTGRGPATTCVTPFVAADARQTGAVQSCGRRRWTGPARGRPNRARIVCSADWRAGRMAPRQETIIIFLQDTQSRGRRGLAAGRAVASAVCGCQV
jgi:hypothetical protein